MYECSAYMYICTVFKKIKNAVGSTRIEVTDGYELPYGYWKLNLGPLKEPSVILTAEISFQPTRKTFKNQIV